MGAVVGNETGNHKVHSRDSVELYGHIIQSTVEGIDCVKRNAIGPD